MDLIFHIIPLFGVIALIYTFWRSSWISKQDAGNEKMKIIAGHIAEGAMAFLKAEYKVLIFFVIVVELEAMAVTFLHFFLAVGFGGFRAFLQFAGI